MLNKGETSERDSLCPSPSKLWVSHPLTSSPLDGASQDLPRG